MMDEATRIGVQVQPVTGALKARFGLGAALVALVALAALALATPASAGYGATAIKNGDFERGNLSGWTAESSGAVAPDERLDEWRTYTKGDRVLPPCAPGSTEPCLGGATLPVPLGRYASVFVQGGPSNGSLSQIFRVGERARYLTLRAFWVNQAGNRPAPPSAPAGVRGEASIWPFAGTFEILPPGGADNQYLSIDLVKRSANSLTTSERDILASGFAPNSATAADSGGWQKVKIPLRKLRGRQVKLRLATVDNMYFLNVGLDSVRVVNARKPKPVTG